MATTLRVSERTRERAAGLARAAGTSIGDIVERALDTYESKQFWSETRDSLEARGLPADEGWDTVDRDGLERD